MARLGTETAFEVLVRARGLEAQGRHIIHLEIGEPDFNTPRHIVDAAKDALDQGWTHYGPTQGLPELRQSIASYVSRTRGIDVGPERVCVVPGGKPIIFFPMMALLDPGDEAVIPAPYWVSYPDMVMLADGLPVTPDATAAQGYKISPRQLEASITPKTRLLLLNSPCNPTGAAYTRAELRALGEVLLEHPRVVIGTDDMYEKIYWGAEPFCSLVTAVPELYGRTVTINGCSKSFAMTGWRIGYCGGPKELITAMATIQGQSTSNASSMAQKAAVAALNGDQDCVAKMNESFKQRHDFVVAGLNAIPGISCLPGAGTFYAFADVTGAMAALGLKDDNAFADHLLTQAGVAVVAGSGFGAPGHMRISFATSMELLEKSLQRIGAVIRQASVARSA